MYVSDFVMIRIVTTSIPPWCILMPANGGQSEPEALIRFFWIFWANTPCWMSFIALFQTKWLVQWKKITGWRATRTMHWILRRCGEGEKRKESSSANRKERSRYMFAQRRENMNLKKKIVEPSPITIFINAICILHCFHIVRPWSAFFQQWYSFLTNRYQPGCWGLCPHDMHTAVLMNPGFLETSQIAVVQFLLHFALFLQLFKRRNVCIPSHDESMLECPIQDPDISSTVPVTSVRVCACLLLCSSLELFGPRIYS